MILTVVVLSVVLALAAALAFTAWYRASRILRLRYRKTVVVTLRSGPAFRGVLFDADQHVVVLRSAELLAEGATTAHPVGVDGELLILRTEVLYVQVP